MPIMTNWYRLGIVRLCLVMLLVWVAADQGALAGPPTTSSGDPMEIAELNDVFFLDPDHGWAIGERGVIWETLNGGRSWQIVDSPTSCRLESICFADETHGWIVGGGSHPYTHASSAIVL